MTIDLPFCSGPGLSLLTPGSAISNKKPGPRCERETGLFICWAAG